MARQTSTRTGNRSVIYRPKAGLYGFPAIIFTDRPVCPDCGAPFEPICPTYGCKGRKAPLAALRAAQESDGSKYAGRLPDGSWGPISRAEALVQLRNGGRPSKPVRAARSPRGPVKRPRPLPPIPEATGRLNTTVGRALAAAGATT